MKIEGSRIRAASLNGGFGRHDIANHQLPGKESIPGPMAEYIQVVQCDDAVADHTVEAVQHPLGFRSRNDDIDPNRQVV